MNFDRVTIEVWREEYDRYGDPLPPVLVASVPNCLFAPQRSVELAGAFLRVETGAAVYLPQNAAYVPQATEQVTIDGKKWAVDGDPAVWPLGIEVKLARVT